MYAQIHIVHIHKHNTSGLVMCPVASLRSPIIHGWRKFPWGSKVLSVTASHTKTCTHSLSTIPSCSIVSVGSSCTARPQDSQATPLPFSPPYNIGLFTASLPSRLCGCVSIMQPFSSHSHIHSRNPVGTTKGHDAFLQQIQGNQYLEKDKLDLSPPPKIVIVDWKLLCNAKVVK